MKGSDTDIMSLCGNAYENNGEHVTEYPSYRYGVCFSGLCNKR